MKKTSIIMTAFIQTPFQAHMTMAAIANITRYTPTDEYELILMSDSEKFPVRDDYKVLKIDRYEKTEGLSYTQSMNKGAELAQHDILVFIQNDVFVWEGWLRTMRWYLEIDGYEAVFPDQCPRSREFVEQMMKMDMVEAKKYGSRDAGCVMITKEAFNRAGGWNGEMSLLAEKDFYERLGKAGVNYTDTCKVMISHIMAATNLNRLHENPQEYDDMMRKDANYGKVT